MNEVTAWIQAIAAIVQAAAAVTIFFITRQYVRLTRDISVAGKEQLKVLRLNQLADEKQRAVALRGRAVGLEARVSALPTQPADTAFRQATLWSTSEIELLQTDASAAISLAVEPASKAAIGLTWILDRLTAVRNTSVSAGYDYPRFFPTSEWPGRLADTLMHLRELIQYADLAQRQAEDSAAELR